MLFVYYTVEPSLRATKNLKIEGSITIIEPQKRFKHVFFLKENKAQIVCNF